MHFAPAPQRAKASGMSDDETRQHILGTWKLIAAVREEIPSGIKTEFLGSTPIGYINYGADGRMLVLTVITAPMGACWCSPSRAGAASPQGPRQRLPRWKPYFAA
jgi:hypothetical protein